MTSTNFTVGLDGTRVSSKVIKPPGGGGSDIFGVGTTQHSAPKDESKKENTQNRLFGSTNESAKKKYVRRNPITGEGIEISDEKLEKEDKNDNLENDDEKKNPEIENKPQAPVKVVQTSIRVRNPPGGKSSGIF